MSRNRKAPTEAQRRVLLALARGGRLAPRLTLHGRTWRSLWAVYRSGGGAPVGRVQAETLHSLLRKKWVQADFTDGRRLECVITPAGRAELEP